MMKKLLLTSFLVISGMCMFAQLNPPVITPIAGAASACSAPALKTYSTSSGNFVSSYFWSSSPSFANVVFGSPNSSVTTVSFPNTTNSYTLYVYASNGISSSPTESFVVSVFETPKVTFSGASIFCQGSSTNIQASPTTLAASSTISYTWNPTTGLNSPNVGSPVATLNSTTNYTITFAIGACTNTAQFTANVAICNGIKTFGAIDNEDLTVYPNPSNGDIFIKGVKKGEVFIYDNIGRLVRRVTISENSESRVTGLLPGVYFILTDNRRQKIIITE